MATFGKDFFGRWVVLLGDKTLGVYANKEAAKQAAERWNAKH